MSCLSPTYLSFILSHSHPFEYVPLLVFIPEIKSIFITPQNLDFYI